MSIVHLTTGLPASGKSTFAKALGILRFNLDDLRAMAGIAPDTWDNDKEAVVVESMVASVKAAIIAGYDVVIDNTHLVPRLPKLYRKEFANLGVTFKIHDFTDVSVDECIRRDAERKPSVGEAVIRAMATRHAGARKNGWRLTDEWMNEGMGTKPEPYVPDPNLPQAILVDLDGTVALKSDERGYYDYSKVLLDAPNVNVVDTVLRLTQYHPAGDTPIFVSGRDDSCYEDSIRWLKMQKFSDPILFMRATGDKRPDSIVKQELFDTHIRHRYNVIAVFDDRNSVVKMWRDMGLTCFQVAEGDF
jgi:predicted kinase